MRILFFLLFPICLSAQINRAYGVIELGPTFPSSSSTGPKFAYRPADSAFYRWQHTNVWIKVVEPSITPDTLYLQQISGTTAVVNGDTINLTPYVLKADTSSMLAAYIKLVGYGIIKTGQAIQADTTSPNGLATRLFAKTLPTIIAANYLATSNGTNLVARNLFDNNAYVGVLNSKPFSLGQWTTAGRPSGVTGYEGYNTTGNGKEWYNGTRWAYALESTFARGTSTYVPFFDANGQLTEHTGIRYNSAASDFGLGGAPSAQLHMQGNKSAASWTTNGIGIRVDAATYTNTTSSGTVAAQTAHNIGAPSFASTSSTTITDAVNFRVLAPTAGTNTTLTRTWGIAAERAWISGRLYASPAPFNINAQGFANLYYTTTPFYSYTGQLSSSNAGIVSQALANATNITTIGIVGAGVSGSAAITGTLIGVLGEAAGQRTMTSGTAWGVYGQARPAGQSGTSSTISIGSDTRLQSSVGGGTQSGANYGLYGFVSERNNHGTALLQGFRWAGVPGSISGSNTGITTYNPLAINFGSNSSGITNWWSYIDHKTSIGAATIATEDLDVFGDVRVRDSLRVATTPAHTSISGFLTKSASGEWVGLATLGSGLTYSGGVLSSTWLKSELESVGNVKISSTNSLTFKQGVTRWTASSDQTGTYISPGYIQLNKTSSGNFGGLINFADTIARDNGFFIQQDDRTTIQNIGTGRQFTIVAENTSLPGTYRWAFGARVDTSTTALSTLRVMLGDRYASTVTPVTVSINAGVQPSESVANAAVTVTVVGDAGKKAFTVNDAITTRMNGKVYFGLDSTLAFDPSTDLLRLSQYGIGNKKASDLGLNKPTHLAAFSPTGTGQGTIVDYPLDSIPTNSIYNNLPNGSVSIDADGNDLEITNMSYLYLGTPDDLDFIDMSEGEITIRSNEYIALEAGQNTNTDQARLYVERQAGGLVSAEVESRFGYHKVRLDSTDFTISEAKTGATRDTLFKVDFEGDESGLVTLGNYNSSASFTPLTLGEDATDLFLTTGTSSGKVMGKAMRQTTKVKDADLTVTDDMLDLSMDIHVWAYCSNAASDSVVIDLPTPGTDYLGQMVSVYGDGRNATLNRDVYVRCVGAKLWHGFASPTAETYYQVTSLTGAINSRTAEFICVQNPDDNLYYWQLKQHP